MSALPEAFRQLRETKAWQNRRRRRRRKRKREREEGGGVELDSGVVIANATTPSIHHWFLVVHLSALAGRLGFQLIDPNPVAGLIFSERHACSAVLACADVRAHPINTLRPRWNTFFSRWQLTSIDIFSTGLWPPFSVFQPFIRAATYSVRTSIKGSIKSGNNVPRSIRYFLSRKEGRTYAGEWKGQFSSREMK